jgi:hypothetical protein
LAELPELEPGTALDAAQVAAVTQVMLAMRASEETRLNTINDYLRDDPNTRKLSGLPTDAPRDVVRLAALSRVNLLKYIVNARVQNMYVDGFRTPTSPDDLDVWAVWQANRMDSRQIGVHRAALSFGTSYVTVMPGTRGSAAVPVLRGFSPRHLTVAYGDDDEWPRFALQCVTKNVYRLIDAVNVYSVVTGDDAADGKIGVVDTGRAHGATWQGEPVCPVVRYRDTEDLDDPGRGIVEPFYPLQDQINITTFSLQVAQHYGAFRQRYVIGWMAESESAALRASAARLMQFADAPGDIAVGEFQQTQLADYISSRESSIRHLATVSQTPVHELLGQFVNLSAEALEAARASAGAAIEENRTVMGESHEQALNLAAEMMGKQPDPAASVVWRDTRVRSLSEAATALGLLAEKLGVPPQELWDRIPGVPQHEIERWKVAAQSGDALGALTSMLDQQARGTQPPAPAPAPATPPVPAGV